MKILGVLALVLLFGCSENKLPKYVELRELRVLGLIAEPPEVDAGGVSMITPVLSDITESTALTYEAVGCLDPGVSVGAEATCAGAPSAVSLSSGSLTTGDMTKARGFTGLATPFSVTAPASSLIFLQRREQDQFNGISYLVTYTVTNSTGVTVKSFKRLIISTRPLSQKNKNPILSDILGDGLVFSTSFSLAAAISVAPSFGAVGAETYLVQQADGSQSTRNEEILTTWFITDGELKSYRTTGADSNTWTTPGALVSGRDTFLLALIRDGRGGLSVVKKCFGTCP
jgi:hypothetical protein